MKKFYALTILVAAAFGVQAQSQRAVSDAGSMKMHHALPQPTGNAPMAIVDSILTPSFFETTDPYCDTTTGYFATAGGFLSGNNAYGDLEKLMKFEFPATGTVVNVQISVFKYTTAGTGTTPVSAVFYGVGPDGAPDTNNRAVSTPITMRTLVNGYNTFLFPNAAIFDQAFFVGLILPQTDGDSILVYQSRLPRTTPPRPNCASTDSAGWERAADRTFLRVADSWGINFEMAMAPRIRYDDAGTAIKNGFAKLVRVSPVPASGSIKVALPSNLEGATTWQILSADGRIISSSAAATAGAELTVSRGNLPAGVYTLRLNTVAGAVNKRIVFAD